MILKFKKAFLFISIALLASGCTKEVPPEMQTNKQKLADEQKMPDDSIHRKFMNNPHASQNSENESNKSGGNEEWEDKAANKITKEADETDAQFRKTKSESDKKKCIVKQLEAANYLMFEADLPPREKYKPALERYRRVLELEPGNEEALANKEQIEEIYRSLGKPIPN